MKPFIPSWLNTYGLPQSDFRVYCCLASRADTKTGIAFPKAETIASDCSMARNTVWKSIRSLEEKQLIRRLGKPFQGKNRYQILTPPIGANETPIDAPSIGANQIPIEQSPIGANETPPIGANQIRQSAQMDSREGNPKKVIQRSESTSIAEAIYQAYPRKVAKPDALKAILRSMKEHDPDFLLERATAYATAISWKEKQFIPYPATWFNKGMFNDDPGEWKQPSTNGSKPKPTKADEFKL